MSTYSNYEMMDIERDEQFETFGTVDRDECEYHMALDDAEKAGEPYFTFDQFMARVESNRRQAAAKAVTLPAPAFDADDDIPF